MFINIQDTGAHGRFDYIKFIPSGTTTSTPTIIPMSTPTSTASPPGSTVVEAEEMIYFNYSVENVSHASGAQILKVVENQTGEASFTFTEGAGTYDLTTHYFDKNDG